MPAPLTFKVNRRLLDEVVTVDDAMIVEAMRMCFQHLKVVVEPSGAVGVAALIAGRVRPGSGRTAVVLSGGNVDWSAFRDLIGRGDLGVAPAPVLAPAGNTAVGALL
jgi:threonine dehydratase